MTVVKLSLPAVFILTAVGFIIATFNLPQASLGNAFGPHYFPMGASALLLLLSVFYFIRSYRERHEEHKEDEDIRAVAKGRTPYIIGGTLIFGVVYALIFDFVGYIIATLLYLGVLMFIINGKSKWLINVLTTIIFTFMSWYIFAELLNISLP
ncbi:tripartite tricarboxylate transporter TctB family protein [Marinococcus halophilus]|uniref:DUF1468 domain-containing protein n=1 Tax=Marinococcus halophilus TaxID=1371 RepID=A0A510Y482_MARHA|nr:tripartite tricarboxylate transporter TctB family protein [Marinococcus halophilus]OZT81672.1 tripartite tricarboxylate transporter TctB family protein [Marinococcus halophilus]GEK57621.1 hypothetical protein MHA01_05260 [Marinococcus halophilus]